MIHLNPEQRVFVTERHLATLTTLRADGTPHVVPVAFTWDEERGCANITTKNWSVKARNAAGYDKDGKHPRAVLCQVDSGRWITLEGTIEVVTDPDEIATVVERYAKRFSVLEYDPARVVLRVTVDHTMSSDYMAS